MRVVLLANDQANQRALACRLAEHVEVAAIALVRPTPKRAGKRPHPLGRIAAAMVGLPFRRAWFAMLAHYDRRFPQWLSAERLEVADVNDSAVVAMVERVGPDLVLVSGTNLLRRDFIAAVDRIAPVLNLHTGISPYVRGAPNCTNWCLATGRFDLIGNTVMWIDAGIDTGDLAATERTRLTGRESLLQLHVAVIDHAHDLLIRCVRGLRDGLALPRVPQREFGEGRLFLSRQWRPGQIVRALANFRFRYKPAALRMAGKENLPLVSLSQSGEDQPLRGR